MLLNPQNWEALQAGLRTQIQDPDYLGLLLGSMVFKLNELGHFSYNARYPCIGPYLPQLRMGILAVILGSSSWRTCEAKIR